MLEYIDAPTLIECLPDIMRHVYASFDMNDREIMCETIKSIQTMVLSHPEVGPELVCCTSDVYHHAGACFL